MAITFDTEKNARNIAERGLSFGRVAELDWDTALVVEDTRRDYGETRLLVMALLDGRLHAAVVTPRGEDLRVISFRRANGREVRLYGEKRRMTGPRARMTTIPSGRRTTSPGRGQRQKCFLNLSVKRRLRS